jgi:glycosyltransferase involved in cell wall biosynthesis
MLIAPVEPWDALICTSEAVRASVELELNMVRADLVERIGATRLAQPRIETIPLGINVADFAPSPEAGRRWREKLGIPPDAIVALYMGRLNYVAKMNPAMMALALEAAAQATGREIHWIMSGWAESDEVGEILHTQTRALCPSVRYHDVDGRPPEVRFSIWHAADFFVSFSDNVQETFGLTPVEAMAAGLPSVISDWNGYRDTVRDGVDGFRIATMAPRPGTGRDLAYMQANAWITYGAYVGAAALLTSVDLRAATAAIVRLIEDPELRRSMGAAALDRARTVFDWSAIIPRYQALWRELGEIRKAAPAEAPGPAGIDNPRRLDPFHLFYSYPSRFITSRTRLAVTAGLSWDEAKARLESPMARFAAFALPTLEEAEQVYRYVSRRASTSVEEVMAEIPEPRKMIVERGMGWLLKFGVLRVADDEARS